MKRMGLFILVIAVLGIFICLIYLSGYRQGSWKIIDSNGNQVSDIEYEDCKGRIEIENKHFFVLTRENRFSVKAPFHREMLFIVDKEGKTIFKGDSKKLEVDAGNNLITYAGHYISIDSKGKIVYKAPKDKVIENGTNYYGLVPFYYGDENVNEDDRRYGYVNMQDEVIIEPQFKRAYPFGEEGLALVVTEEGKNGFIDINGEYVIPPIYDDAERFSEGLAHVRVGEKSAYVDTEGNIVLEKKGGYFHEGFASIKNEEGKEAYIDKSGKLLTDYDYDIAHQFQNGYAIVTVDGLHGVINTKGEFVIEPKYNFLGSFSDDGLASLEGENSLWGFINTKGEWQIEPQYETVYGFSDGVAAVKVRKE